MRMVFFRFLMLAVLCSAFFGCGDASNSQGVSVEVIELAYSEPMPRKSDGTYDHRWRYVFRVDPSAISGSKNSPFVTGQFNNQKETLISDADRDGLYDVEIITFNQEMAFTYGGDFDAKSYADITGSQYYSPADKKLVIGFKNGAIYQKGTVKFPLPQEVAVAPGDDDVRISASYSLIVIYLNNTKVSGLSNNPFFMGDYRYWISDRQEIIDSSGWGKVVIWNDTLPRFIKFKYGGDNTPYLQQDWSWPITDSAFFDKKTNVFNIAIGMSGKLSPGF